MTANGTPLATPFVQMEREKQAAEANAGMLATLASNKGVTDKQAAMGGFLHV